MPLATLAITYGPSGPISPGDFEAILNSLIESFTTIYGSDVVLTPDSQDYEWLVVLATAYNDENNANIAAYNSMRPLGAQGAGLSAIVLINGLRRIQATNSTVVVSVFGTAGTPLNNCVVQDQNGNLWNLPVLVTIPPAGVIAVTATAQQPGNIAAAINTVTIRYTPTRGWASVTNSAAATPGIPVEQDGILRQRQAKSTALPAQTPLSSIAAVIANLAGVGRSTVYENQGATTDGNGIPSHSIAAVVEGGDITEIAQAIESKKSPGTGTYGTTMVEVEDPSGVPINIAFFELAEVQIYVSLTIHPLTGYTSSIGDELIAAIVAFINSLGIGTDVYYTKMFGPANLYGSPDGLTYNITALTIGIAPAPVGTVDLPIDFNAAAITSTPNIVLTVV